MYNKRDILKTLSEYNYFIEETVLDSFIKNWKIDPIYEDEDGVEFFDNLSIIKLKKGISLKSQGYNNEEIIYHIGKVLADNPVLQGQEVVEKAAEAVLPTEVLNPAENPIETVVELTSDFKNVTVDITNQTLQMLADAVAEKITTEIKQQIQCSDLMQPALLENPLKEKNEQLKKQVDELLEDNKKLAERIQKLEGNKFCFLTWLENLIVLMKK